MSLVLSRVEIESVGSDPRKLARALLAQLPAVTGPVPIEAIARALDIVSIEVAPLSGIEGCLQCDPLKSEGQIVVNANSPPRRRRYTIAHELGHFLNERHRPTIDFGFACTADDMAKPRRTGPHQRQETEANIFAIEVLTPRSALGSTCGRRPSSTTRLHWRRRSRSAAKPRSGAMSLCRASASRRCSPRAAASATSRRARASRPRPSGPATAGRLVAEAAVGRRSPRSTKLTPMAEVAGRRHPLRPDALPGRRLRRHAAGRGARREIA